MCVCVYSANVRDACVCIQCICNSAYVTCVYSAYVRDHKTHHIVSSSVRVCVCVCVCAHAHAYTRADDL